MTRLDTARLHKVHMKRSSVMNTDIYINITVTEAAAL
jgi:hypothetical protein